MCSLNDFSNTDRLTFIQRPHFKNEPALMYPCAKFIINGRSYTDLHDIVNRGKCFWVKLSPDELTLCMWSHSDNKSSNNAWVHPLNHLRGDMFCITLDKSGSAKPVMVSKSDIYDEHTYPVMILSNKKRTHTLLS